MAKKPIKKPTGKTGFIRIKPDEQHSLFKKIEFPKHKDEIESFIVQRFWNDLLTKNYLPFDLIGYEQNDIDDFDFTLHTSEGKKYLELMEVAPLEHVKGGYDKAPYFYNIYDFSKAIYDKLMGKSNKYKNVDESSIFLLIYPTDYKFDLSETGIALLQYWTITQSHYFEYIFYFSLLDESNGISHLIYPTSREFFEGFDENNYRESMIYLPNPEKWVLVMPKSTPMERAEDQSRLDNE